MRIDGPWRMTWAEYGGRTGVFSAADFDDSRWLAADVPGDVHLDLLRAGLLPDPFVGLGTDAALWMEQKDWWYRTRLRLPQDWAEGPGRATRLVFHGLDAFATVYLDGRVVGRHANMFRPLKVDVTGLLGPGREHVLAVRLASPLFAPLEGSSRQETPWGHPRQLSRKAQMSYGWDIAPRLVTIGIWQPVELVAIRGARIADVWVRTRALEGPAGAAAAAAEMEAAVTVEVIAGAGDDLRVALEADGRTVEQAVASAPGLHEVRFAWRMESPRLWWPNGSGEAGLYPYRVRLVAPGPGLAPVDARAGQFGVRTVELDRSPTADGGHRFAFRVNGREIFMRGWNWTPPDALFARATPARRAELLAAAHQSGANMLRVWGGGVYEADDFFDEADRLGLLVFQDFMFACSRYPQDEAFLAEVRAEAEHVVRRLRGRPCLALWSGDNECDACYPTLHDAAANRLTREVLADVVRRLDPDRPYLPSSPHSPAGRCYNDPTDSEAHLWKHGASYLDPYFREHRAKFVSETGFLSLPGVEVIRACLGGAALWPPEGPAWDHHATDAFRTAFFRGMKALAEDLRACGRPAPRTLEEYVAVSQELQAAACRTWIADCAARPDCGGILIWNLADCWPQMSDAAIAWPFHPKKVYAAVKGAFAAIGRR
jgi:beta-mannosidase